MSLKPHASVIFQPVSEGAVLLHSETEIYFGLNQVGAAIWELIVDECESVDLMVEAIHKAYPDAEPDMIRADVQELLAELEAQGLLVRGGSDHEADHPSQKAPQVLEPSKS